MIRKMVQKFMGLDSIDNQPMDRLKQLRDLLNREKEWLKNMEATEISLSGKS